MKKYLFTYGSLILNKHNLGFTLSPVSSVFIKSYRLVVEKSNITKTNYHFLKLKYTGNDEDVVPGFLLEVSDEQLVKLDKYEGSTYLRKEIDCYSRQMDIIKCEAYF